MSKLLKLLFGAAIPAPWDIYSFIITAMPIISTIAAVSAGYLEGIQWSWLIMIAAVTFGGTGNGLFHYSLWRQRQNANDKLAFSSGRIAARASSADTKEIAVGFELRSTYDYPLECKILRISTRIADRVPQSEVKLPQVFDIPPHGVMWFDDCLIAVDAPRDGALQGTVDFEVIYGRKGGRKYEFSTKKLIHIGFDNAGKINGANWTNAV